jgi:hypothetical protein
MSSARLSYTRHDPEAEVFVMPDEREQRYGDPSREAVGRAVRAVATARGKDDTREALLDLAAVCIAWARSLT